MSERFVPSKDLVSFYFEFKFHTMKHFFKKKMLIINDVVKLAALVCNPVITFGIQNYNNNNSEKNPSQIWATFSISFLLYFHRFSLI